MFCNKFYFRKGLLSEQHAIEVRVRNHVRQSIYVRVGTLSITETRAVANVYCITQSHLHVASLAISRTEPALPVLSQNLRVNSLAVGSQTPPEIERTMQGDSFLAPLFFAPGNKDKSPKDISFKI